MTGFKLPAGVVKTFKDIQLNFEKLTSETNGVMEKSMLRDGSASMTGRLTTPGIYLTGNVVMDTNSYKLGARSGVNNFGGDTWEFTTGATAGAVNGDSAWAYVRAQGFLTMSDETMKENVTSIGSVWAKIQRIGVYSYGWKDDHNTTTMGVLAQEVSKEFPEAVSTAENGQQSVDYSQLVAVTLAAVQELQKRVEALERKKK